MKLSSSAAMSLWLMAAAFDPAAGFAPSPKMIQRYYAPATATTPQSLVVLQSTSTSVDSDVSIPYNAAARLAYDEWRAQYDKGDFDEKRFQSFEQNYETITVANVVAKKKAREDGTVSLSLMTMNEFGDYTESEYTSMMNDGANGDDAPVTTTGEVLSQAVEAAELQTEASNALGEAADALAEEEQLLVEKLGLESIDELEVALDSLDGIAPDGGELEPDNIAREARVREAYLNWCKDLDKEPDETRFATFSNNFLTMEQYTKEANKEMTLNQYADCTQEEYEAMQAVAEATEAVAEANEAMAGASEAIASKPDMSAPPPAPKASTPAPAPSGAKTGLGLEGIFQKAKMAVDAGLKDIESKASTESNEERIKAMAEAQKKSDKQAAEARAQKQKEVAARAQQEVERRKQIESEKAERAKALEKDAAKQQQQAEAAAIAAAREASEREATQAAQRSYFDMQAAEQVRKQAREAQEKQDRLRPKPVAKPKPKKMAENPLASLFAPKPAPAKAKKAPPAIAKVLAPKPAPKVVARKPAPAPKAPPAVAKVVSPKPAPKKAAPTFSLFGSLPSKKAAPKAKVSPAPAPQAAKKAAAKAPTFSLFGPPPPKKASPAPAPAPAQKAKAPTFSLFGPPPPKKAPVAAPARTPPADKPAGTFSLFGAPPPKKTPAKKAAAKKPASSGTLSVFGSQAVQKKPVPKKKDVKVPNRSGTISLFGANGAKPKPKPTPQPKKAAPAKKASTPFSLFGKSKPKAAPEPVKAPEPAKRSQPFSMFGSSTPKAKPDVKVPNRAGTIGIGKKAPAPKAESKPAFSFFGGSKPTPKAAGSAAPAGVPTLSAWKQNPDGSITGKIAGSPNFRAGTEITTSPVRKGAKAASVIKTGSGSKYYLS